MGFISFALSPNNITWEREGAIASQFTLLGMLEPSA